jgi:hypothetical protein
MTTAALTWEPGQDTIDADIAATIAKDRAAWESAGATFTEVDDGDGERPGLATGTLGIDGRPAHFGVLDYGDETTHLLIPGTSTERQALTTRVIGELISAGVLTDDMVLEIIGLAKPATVEAKMEYLADVMQERLTALQERFLSPSGDEASSAAGSVRSTHRLADTLRDLATIRATVQVGEREEPVEILGSGRDLQGFVTRRLAGGTLISGMTVDLLGDADAVIFVEAQKGGEPFQMVLDGLDDTSHIAADDSLVIKKRAFYGGSLRVDHPPRTVERDTMSGVIRIRLARSS